MTDDNKEVRAVQDPAMSRFDRKRSSRAGPVQDPAMSLPHEEAVRHYLKQTAENSQKQTQLIKSIKGWVTFFGILTLSSLLLLGLIYLIFAIN